MDKTMCQFEPEVALQRLCSAPAADFGARLLARAEGPAIPFRAFVVVARDMIVGTPDAAALWLAALVALQMCREQATAAAAAAAAVVTPPSAN